MQQINRRTPIPKCDYNKVAFQRRWGKMGKTGPE